MQALTKRASVAIVTLTLALCTMCGLAFAGTAQAATVTVMSSNGQAGLVVLNGDSPYQQTSKTFWPGDEVTCTAVPNEGYEFVNWTDTTDDSNHIVVSENPVYTFTIQQTNVYLQANFQKKSGSEDPGPVQTTSTITVKGSPSGAGTISVNGSAFSEEQTGKYADNSGIELTAQPAAGYKFKNWTVNGEVKSTDETFTYTVWNQDVTVQANFVPQFFNVTAEAAPAEGGTVTINGSKADASFTTQVDYGDTATVDATASSTYEFVNWTIDGTVVSEDPHYVYTVKGATTLTANFKKLSTSNVTIKAVPNAGGTISVDGSTISGEQTNEYADEATIELTAQPATGYKFKNWTVNGEVKSTDETFDYKVFYQDVTVQANFTPLFYSVTAEAAPAEGGTVTINGSKADASFTTQVDYGDTATVDATAKNGYEFENWTIDGKAVSDEAHYVYTVTGGATLTANFKKLPGSNITVTAAPSGSGTISVNDGEFVKSQTGEYANNDAIKLTAKPAPGYKFKNWTVNGEVKSTDETFDYTVWYQDVTVQANFVIQFYSVTAEAAPAEGGTVTINGSKADSSWTTQLDYGDDAIVDAVAKDGYEFVNWTVDGEVASDKAHFVYNVKSGATLIANFRLIPTSLAKAVVTAAAATYTGKALTPDVTVTLDGKTLKAGTDYDVAYTDNVNAGTATATVTGKGAYTGTAAGTFAIAKAANTVKAKAKSKTLSVKAKDVKKKAKKISAKKAFKVSKAQGKVTYKKTSGNKKIAVSKSGKVTVKKGLKKGTYKVKVKVTAAGNGNYGKATKTVTLKVKVK